MVIGDFYGYPSLGLGANFSRIQPKPERSQVILEAQLDPKKPNEYAVRLASPSITPPEKTAEVRDAGKRFPKNDAPVSRIFNAIEDYQPRPQRIDIYV